MLAPELHPGRPAVGLGDQQAPGAGLVEQRVVAQQARLDVGAQAHALVGVAAGEAGGIGELVAVPGEDVALVADRGVAAGQVEAVAEDVVAGATVQELMQCRRRPSSPELVSASL